MVEPARKKARTEARESIFLSSLLMNEGHAGQFYDQSSDMGHPDVLYDQSSDAVLDACLTADPLSTVVCRTAGDDNVIKVAGEIEAQASVDSRATLHKDAVVEGHTVNTAAPPQVILGNAVSLRETTIPVLVRIDAFPALTQRSPADICCIIDISGSMGDEARIQDAAGNVERHGLSLLDVAKHAVRTVIHSIGPQDRLSIVCFNSDARVVLPLTLMSGDARRDAESKLDELKARGGTNIWAGLERGLDALRPIGPSSMDCGRRECMQHVLLLTDGQDCRSSGAQEKLQHFLSESDSSSLTISTFGFGYGIDSALLVKLASIGGGNYSFIPDAGFVGTVFVNAISNLLVTVTSSAYLQLQPGVGVKIARIPGVDTSDVVVEQTGATQVKIGVLQIGQTRDVVVYIIATSEYVAGGVCLTAQVGFKLPGNRTSLSPSVQVFGDSAAAMLQVEPQVHRCDMVDTLGAVLQNPIDRARSLALVQQLGDRIRSSESVGDSFVASLLEDVQDQVTMALSDDASLRRWGLHYLPSLMFAHKHQQCNNFKDRSVQMYGGSLFKELQDVADDNFNELPPPKPSLARSSQSVSGSTSAPVVNMAAYNNCYGG